MKRRLLNKDLTCGQLSDVLFAPVGSHVHLRYSEKGKIFTKVVKVVSIKKEGE
jgi:hypothetical protein